MTPDPHYVLGIEWVPWHDVARTSWIIVHNKKGIVEQPNVLPMVQQSMLGGYMEVVKKGYSLSDTSCCTLLGSSSSEFMNLFTRLMETLA